MHSVITSKFQITIPKGIRERFRLSVHDTLDWEVVNGKVVVTPVQKRFLSYRNVIKTGPGNIKDDLKRSRKRRVEKYQ
jgi:AbrB family looped-hinge helix DNA binding protein